jgi:hypothetical protein
VVTRDDLQPERSRLRRRPRELLAMKNVGNLLAEAQKQARA